MKITCHWTASVYTTSMTDKEHYHYIIGYNDLYRGRWNNSEESSVMKVLREKIETLINDEARMLSFRYNAFEISYLPKGKQAIYTSANTWGRENSQTAKPARIIQKILNREFKCKEFEDFSNWIKNEILEAGEFVLVSGSDITKYYNEENYVEVKGTLGNSCMRYDTCQKYFKVYEDHATTVRYRLNTKWFKSNMKKQIDGTYTLNLFVNPFFKSTEYREYCIIFINGVYCLWNKNTTYNGNVATLHMYSSTSISDTDTIDLIRFYKHNTLLEELTNRCNSGKRVSKSIASIIRVVR